MPGYVLAPEARVAAIVRMVATAVAEAAATVPGPLRLTGHSAGGHLVARLACADGGLPAALRARLGPVLPISGLFDLRPLLRTAINDDLRLDPAEAAAESPALLEPLDGLRLHAWVGAAERPEFVRQSRLIANVWTGLGADTALTVEPGAAPFRRDRRPRRPGVAAGPHAGCGRGGSMNSQARVVVIGGGVVGCSVLYHLARAPAGPT